MNIFQKAIRGAKDVALRRSDTEILVRDATNNEQWGPSGSDMRQIADLTYSPTDYTEIMTTLWERLEDTGKNWRHVYKGLLVIDYLIKNGSERVVQECKFRSLAIKTLSEFQFIDEDEKDQGLSVRQRAKAIVELINDEKRLNAERQTASKNRDKFGQAIGSDSGFQQSHVYARGSSSRQASTDRYGSPGYGGGGSGGGNDRYGGGSSTSTSRTTAAPAYVSSSDSESDEAAPAPRGAKKTKAKKTANGNGTTAKTTAAAPDLLGFDAFASPSQPQNGGNDFFDPRGSAQAPQQKAPVNNHIEFFGNVSAPPAQQSFAPPPQVQQAPPQQQQLPGNPQRLPNGNLLVQGHEITVQKYQEYLQYVQQQAQMQQQGQMQQQQQMANTQQQMSQVSLTPQQPQQPPQQQQMFAPAPVAAKPRADDDWNDFTSASTSKGFNSPMLTPSTNGATTQASPAKPKDKFDDLLDLSALGSGASAQSAQPKSTEPTLAQLQAQRQAQAQQQAAFGFGQQPQYAQPQAQNNGFFF